MNMHQKNIARYPILQSNTFIVGMFKFRGRSGDGSQMVMVSERVGGGGSGTVSVENLTKY